MTNVTLTIPTELVRQARILAAQRNTSMSALVADMLASSIGKVDDDEAVWRREEAAMAVGLLEVGPLTWTRDEVHAR